MSDITFTDDAEREFWEAAYLRTVSMLDADYAARERRKRIGAKPQPVELPVEVRRVLAFSIDAMLDAKGKLAHEGFINSACDIGDLLDAILAARKAVGLDAKEGQQ